MHAAHQLTQGPSAKSALAKSHKTVRVTLRNNATR